MCHITQKEVSMAMIRRSIVMKDESWRLAKSEAALAGKTLSGYIEGLIPTQEIDPWIGTDRFVKLTEKVK